MDFRLEKDRVDENNLEEFLCAASPEMREVASEIRLYAPLDFPILIEGASGTGKELVARAIHSLSGRASSPFFPINLVEGAETLFESTLFGHRKGAFTGAEQGRIGCIEMAKDGTIFMDEVNSLPKFLQPKLLRVLEEKVYWPVGSMVPSITKARFVFASNQKLMNMLKDGSFRDDVMYRLGRIIRLPLLRDRLEDMHCLSTRLVAESSRNIIEALSRSKPNELVMDPILDGPPRLSEDALIKLRSHSWPGNIRELKVVMERAVLVCKNKVILPKDIEFDYPTDNGVEEYHVALENFNEKYFSRVASVAGENIRLGIKLTGLSETSYRRKLRKYRYKKRKGMDEGRH